MNLARKLERYLESNGIMKKFAANYIGMKFTNFSAMLRKETKIPVKYWEAIIKLTNYAFTVEDFIEYAKYVDQKKLKGLEKKNQEKSG